MTMLHKVFEVYPNELSAVNSFDTSRAKA